MSDDLGHPGPLGPDDDLRALVADAVADVDPTDRLDTIRSQTARSSRRGWYTVGGSALLAAAAVVTVAVVVGGGDAATRPDQAAPASPTTTSTTPTTEPGGPTTEPGGPTEAVGLYFIGETPSGPRLYREFQQVPQFDETLDVSVAVEALAEPLDPDYDTAWPVGTVTGARIVEGEVRVYLASDAPDDDISLQQLRATVAAASGLQLMTFYRDGDPFVVEPDPGLLSPVSISDPSDGRAVSGTFTARGVAIVALGTVPWRIEDGDGEVVASGEATSTGAPDRLRPWETVVDVSGLAPGAYTFVATTAFSGVPDSEDTRVVLVEEPPPAAPEATSAYFVGAGPDGPDAPPLVLYRTASTSTGSVLDALTARSTDPDYRTLWQPGAFVGASEPEAGMTFVELADESLAFRPAGMSRVEAALAIEQVLWSVQDLDGAPLAVQFRLDGNPISQVYGVPTSEPLVPGEELTVLSHMIIDSPVEEASYDGSFTATGRANSYEGTVFCQLLDATDRPAWEEATISGGLLDATLAPWRLRVDLAGVAPGTYTFRCQTDDPTAGTEGRGADVDTRTITVE